MFDVTRTRNFVWNIRRKKLNWNEELLKIYVKHYFPQCSQLSYWNCIEFASNIKCIWNATHIFKIHKSIWKISRMMKHLILFGVTWRFFTYQRCIENSIWKWKRDNRWKDEWKPDINRQKTIETQKKNQVPCSKKGVNNWPFVRNERWKSKLGLDASASIFKLSGFTIEKVYCGGGIRFSLSFFLSLPLSVYVEAVSVFLGTWRWFVLLAAQ